MIVSPGRQSAMSSSRSTPVRVAFNSTGTTPTRSAPRTAHTSPADEGRQKATRSPAPSPAASRAPAARRWAARRRVSSQHRDLSRSGHGSSLEGSTTPAPAGIGSPSAVKILGRIPATAAITPRRMRAAQMVTARTPM